MTDPGGDNAFPSLPEACL